MNEETFTRVTGQAGQMLQAALREDWGAALSTAREVAGSGMNELFLMLTALADWTVQAQSEAKGKPVPEAGSLGRPAWMDEDGNLTLDAGQVRPAEAWAGQFVTARAAMDHATTEALFRALPPDCGPHIQVLLESCAASVSVAGRAS